jgi:two-component system CheB/CheR fusion protein
MAVEPDHVYVIPPNTNMTIQQGILRLAARTLTRGQHLPVDSFFRSLADECGHKAIGVVLSGMASDGADGCCAIKAAGGFTFAQDEKSAKYSSMPRSAVAAGGIDFVLPPKDIARELATIGQHPYRFQPEVPKMEGVLPKDVEHLGKIYQLLRNACGVDFAYYKQSTLQRRIKRRMVLNKIGMLPDYVDFLKTNSQELEKLYRDILIHVTGFFREPAAFEALRKVVFPRLVEGRRPNTPIRVWVPGCSSGEEAYSIAIALLEFLERRGGRAGLASPKPFQIFATDISDSALEKGRAAVYPESIASEVSPERLRHFFVKLDTLGYQISKPLRDMCLFARQNVTTDPPFSNLDLISCRNLLIYLGPALQKCVLPILHYALKPHGFLMLGASENLSGFAEHFIQADKKCKIYAKKTGPVRLPTAFTEPAYAFREGPYAMGPKRLDPGFSVEKEAERLLLSRYVPPSIVVNEQMEIVHIKGHIGAYLEPAAGQPTFSLSKMAREGLLIDLRATISKAKKDNAPARKEGVRVQVNGAPRVVNLEVMPFRSDSPRERYFLVLFEESPGRPLEPKKAQVRRGQAAKAEEELERGERARLRGELGRLREQLRTVIEEHETTAEEFRSANEEVLSANEELQSTNEELETAKEELQSSNEELTTVNEELHNRNVELSAANNDLLNLLANVNIPVVIVDDDLRIRRFTPPSQRLLNLLPSDVGRRIGEVRPNLKIEDLEAVTRHTMDAVEVQEREVQDKDGYWYAMHLRPYKTWENKIAGAVISFQDIDILKRTLDKSRDYAGMLLETAQEAILILDANLRVQLGNPSFYQMFRVSPQETEGQFIYNLGKAQWNIPQLRKLLEEVISKSSRVDDFEVEHDFPQIGRKTMRLNARRISGEGDRPLVLLTIVDCTEQKAAEQRIRMYESIVKNATVGLAVMRFDDLDEPQTLRLVDANPAVSQVAGVSLGGFIGQPVVEHFPDMFKTKIPETYLAEVVRTGRAIDLGEVHYGDKRIREGTFSVKAFPLPNNCVGVALENVTESKQAEEALRQQAALLDLAHDAIFVCGVHDRIIRFWNRGAVEKYGWTEQEAVGKSAHELLHTEFPKPLEEIQTEVVQRGRWEGELVHRTREGSRLVVASRWALQRDAVGEPLAILEINTDIPQGKRAETAVR